MMTRDEFENKLELILDSDTGADCTVVFDELIAHDDEQRAVIESANKTNEYLASTIQKWEEVCQNQYQQIEQQAKEIESMHRALGCSRSHPHEEMHAVCELKTEIARLKNELSHWTFERFNQLGAENKTLRAALQAICYRAPIMGSTGEYRAGQLDALEAVRQQVQHALNNVKASAERDKETQVLREALQLLYDTQNGCPLPKYEKDWNRAMELAARVLKEVSG